MEWIKIETQKPTKKDGLVVVLLESGFEEIVYFSEKGMKILKPWRYNKYDIPISDIKSVKYWLKLTEPIE